MKNLYKLIVLTGMALFLGSCYYDTYQEEVEVPIPPDVEISYSEDIQPLWDRDCVRCHPPSPPNLQAANSYNSLLNGFVVPGNAEGSRLYQSLLGSNGVSLMPPGARWGINDINKVKKWIDDGAENN